MAAMLVRISDGSRHAVALPYVLGRRDPGPIPSSANRVSRTAACVHAGADGALSIRSTHDAPVVVVRAGRLHQVWKGGLLRLINGDVVIPMGYNLMKTLGVARDTAPENTAVGGADLAQYHACRLELGAGLAAAQPAAQQASQSTPAFTPALATPARSVAAASQPSLAAQLEQARAEANRARAEVVQLVLESLVAQVAQQARGVDRGSGDSTAVTSVDRGSGDGTVLIAVDRGSGDGTVLATVDRGSGDDMVVTTADRGSGDDMVVATAPPGPTAGPPRKRPIDSKPATTSPSKRSKPAAASELIGSACGTVLSASRRYAAELSETHATLHGGAELWTEDVPEDRTAAKQRAKDLQAAVDREAQHVSDITAAVTKVTAEVSTLLAPTKSLDSQATASLKGQQAQAKARLATLRTKLKLAQENSAPLLAQMKKEAADELSSALDDAREPIKPDDWHCSECCGHDDDYGYGYRGRRGYGYGRECPGYDCSGTECDCWREEAETELNLSGVVSVVKKLLLPVGSRGAPGSDLVSRNWEAAISRVRAVAAVLQDWAEESELVEDAQFQTICSLVGETWQSVAVWVDESVVADYGLASELQQLVDDDGDSFVVQAGSMETHTLALKLVQVPWSSPALRNILSGTPAPVRSVEPPQVSVIRMQRLFSERRYTEALALSKHAESNYYAAKAMIKLDASFEDLEKHVTATCKNSASSSLEALAKFVQDDESSAMKKYLLLGYAVLQRSAAPTKANAVGIMFTEFLRAAMHIQPTGSAISLPSPSVGSSALFESSLAMLRGYSPVGDASPPMVAAVAAVMISTIASSHGELTTLVAEARNMGNTHPREMFVVLRKLVELQQKPVAGHARLYSAKPSVDLEKLCLMVELAAASTDVTLKQEAQRLATDVDKSADPLCMVKLYGKLGDEDTAVVFARRIYATKHQLRPAQLSELIDFMLSAGQVNALLVDVKNGTGAGTIAEKLTRHLRETGTNMQALADLTLHSLRNNKVIEDESAVKLANDAVQAAMKVGAAAVTTAVSTICELVKASFKPKSAASMPYSHQRSHVVERNQANLILNGKKKVEDALKKIRPTQEGLLKIAGQLVEHQHLAARLVEAADQCGSVSGVEMMKQVFQKNLTHMPCRVNHGSWQTMCQSCLRAYGAVVEAAAAACYGCSSSGPVVLQLVDQCASALKRPVLTVLRGIPAQVQQSPIAALGAPVFAGFVQEPVDVAKFCKSESASAVPVGATVPDGASAPEIGKWVSALLGELLGPAVCERLHQVCVEEQLDASVLLSMSIEDITEVFEFENTVEEMVAAKIVSLGVKQQLQHEPQQTIPWEEWWKQHGYGSVFPTALGHIDSGVLCAFSDEELHGFAAQAFRENCVGLEKGMRALRNTVQHSPQSVVSAVSQQRENPFTIVVIGGTGAGKSTCLNSLLGEVQILPTNCMRACTATIIEMTHLASANAGERYVATINFVTKDEWAQELNALCYHIAKAKAEAPEEAKATDWLVGDANDAVIKLRSIYGSGMEAQILSADLSSLQACEKVNHLLENGEVRLGADTASDLSQKLETMGLDSDNDTSDGATWPLTKTVNVQGPWPLLQQGVRLVDAPGLHDDNSARASVVKGYLAKADSIFLVSNIKRAVNDKTTKDLLTLDLRRNLLATGKLGQLAFICTQSDELVASEIRENLRLNETATVQECAAARNAYAQKKLTADFYTGIDANLRPVNRAQGSKVTFEFPVFTVSSVDWQKLAGVRKNDGAAKVYADEKNTQIPALRGFIEQSAKQYFDDDATWTSAEAEVAGPNWELNVVKEGENAVMPAGTLYWFNTSTRQSHWVKSAGQLVLDVVLKAASATAAAAAPAPGRDLHQELLSKNPRRPPNPRVKQTARKCNAIMPRKQLGNATTRSSPPSLAGVSAASAAAAAAGGNFLAPMGNEAYMQPAKAGYEFRDGEKGIGYYKRGNKRPASSPAAPSQESAKRVRASAAITPPADALVIDLCDDSDD